MTHHFLLLLTLLVKGSDGDVPPPAVRLTSTSGGAGLVRATKPSDKIDPRRVPRPRKPRRWPRR